MDRGIKPVDYYRDEKGKIHPIWGVDWHYVGASGEPTFQNSWQNVGSQYQLCRFGKTVEGRLLIEGRVTGGTVDSVIFTLSPGYRPLKTMAFKVFMPISGYIEISLIGEVKAIAA